MQQAHDLLDDVRPVPQATRAADPSHVLTGLVQLSRIASALPDAFASPDPLDRIISKGVLRHLLTALQIRDEATIQHSRRVAQIASGAARSLGWDGPRLKLLEVAALLHDVGKIGIPDSILFKDGKLSPDEAEFMAVHVNVGLDVLQAGRAAPELIQIVDQAACIERLPAANARKGGDVHQGARILAAADTYDSLRVRGTHNEIMQALAGSAGTLFEENIIAAVGDFVEQHAELFAETPAASIPPSSEAEALGRVFSQLYVLETLHDGFFLVDADLRVFVWNRGVESLLGVSANDALGSAAGGVLQYADDGGSPLADDDSPLIEALHNQEPLTRQVQLRRSDGKFIPVEVQTVPLLDSMGQLCGVMQNVHDLSRKKRASKKSKKDKPAADASPRRRADFDSALKRAVKERKKAEEAVPFCVMFIEVDHFPLICDKFGAEAAEQVLLEVSKLLQQESYAGELVARDSEAKFAVLCPECGAELAESRAERLRIAVCATEVNAIGKFNLSASIGISEVEPKDSPATICGRATKALAMVQQAGCNQVRSLSAAQMVEADNQGLQSGSLQYNTSFDACIAADMVIYKLGGFVTDENAKLVKVKSKSAVLRIGKGGLVPVWGSKPQRQPIEIRIDFGEENIHETRATKSVEIRVEIRPRGFPMSTRRFHERAVKIAKVLRSYFGAVQ
jgi:diguanylate cyclase (GGDEF)-like protein/putative nucleotidyltransferase with HDIG domain/PAS domain S-box-containing protein